MEREKKKRVETPERWWQAGKLCYVREKKEDQKRVLGGSGNQETKKCRRNGKGNSEETRKELWEEFAVGVGSVRPAWPVRLLIGRGVWKKPWESKLIFGYAPNRLQLKFLGMWMRREGALGEPPSFPPPPPSTLIFSFFFSFQLL